MCRSTIKEVHFNTSTSSKCFSTTTKSKLSIDIRKGHIITPNAMDGVNKALGLANYDVVALEAVRARLHPLVANLDSLMREMNMTPETPLGW